MQLNVHSILCAPRMCKNSWKKTTWIWKQTNETRVTCVCARHPEYVEFVFLGRLSVRVCGLWPSLTDTRWFWIHLFSFVLSSSWLHRLRTCSGYDLSCGVTQTPMTRTTMTTLIGQHEYSNACIHMSCNRIDAHSTFCECGHRHVNTGTGHASHSSWTSLRHLMCTRIEHLRIACCDQ